MSEVLQKNAESQAKAAQKGKGFGIVENTAAFGAGAGGGFGLNAPGTSPKVKHFSGSGKKTLDVPAEIADAWLKVLDDEQSETFLVAKYATNGKSLELIAVGTGGLEAFKDALPTDECSWGGFRCTAVDDRGNLVCRRPKFVFVMSTPAAASIIKKAKMAPHKGAVKEAIKSVHLDITVEDKDTDLSETNLVEKLQAATGAHKPNGYEFEEGKFVEADYYGLGIGTNCKAETSKTA
eukprot:CAMPEP_0197291236 /NCGR_PEP_ID=MMETSP0890-20130614/11770_1 /TAXON_ID=44058 ORGANISM="Aureoumbra lagunensis, Strain CCMP1510" /NCGR_SAMPLE_ID=MMETSP0890 /ASSEMBLY_ACC=CAM_ASM_000533 /LENGTH=235 /DNA_ID=CAMNT_0042763885 /DNA_START=24 /DNA_END=731 /DNA_ORIENTATION=-